MRVFAYIRIDPKSNCDLNNEYNYLLNCGFQVKENRFVCEEVAITTPILFRDKIVNLVNYGLEEDNVLIVNGIDCFGANFTEIFDFLNIIFNKNIVLICLEFSRSEIKGDLKFRFLDFIKISANFESKLKINNISSSISRKVGRPEILNYNQKEEVLEKFKKGCSIYALAKEYSVTRTVIKGLLKKKMNC